MKVIIPVLLIFNCWASSPLLAQQFELSLEVGKSGLTAKRLGYNKNVRNHSNNYLDYTAQYGDNLRQSKSFCWSASFAYFPKILENKNFRVGVKTGVKTYNNYEQQNIRNTIDYPYEPFLQLKDSNLIAEAKFTNVLYSIGLPFEYQIKKFGIVASINFLINGYGGNLKADGSYESRKPLFKSRFSMKAGSIDSGEELKISNVENLDVNHNGVFDAELGAYYKPFKKIKFKIIYSHNLTPVNFHKDIQKLFYSSLSMGLIFQFK